MPDENINCIAVIQAFERLRDHAWDIRDGLQRAHPEWGILKDARLTSLSRFGNVLHSAHANFTFLAQALLNDSQKKLFLVPDEAKNEYVRSAVDFVKNGLLLLAFSSVESSFRSLLKALDDSACNKGTAEFKSIYECLLKGKLSITSPEAFATLEISRLMRNTIHNNGVYFTRDGRQQKVSYRAKEYTFSQSERIKFATFDFVLEVSEDLLRLLIDVVNHQKILAIQKEITEY